MEAYRNRGNALLAVAASVFLASFCGPQVIRGDDLVTLSGMVYHDVRPIRVEPDGVTWQYDEGMCKVDFTDSPEKVRQAYHYDAAKAAAYHAAQVQARQEAEAQARRALQENDARRLARAQASSANASARPGPDADIIFRRAASPAASEATKALGQQMEAAAAKQAAEPTGVWGALARSRAGTILSMAGVNFGPGGPPPNAAEYKAEMHHAPSAAQPTDTAHDSFYTPDYSSKSYYEDMDRSAAFLRNVPLK